MSPGPGPVGHGAAPESPPDRSPPDRSPPDGGLPDGGSLARKDTGTLASEAGGQGILPGDREAGFVGALCVYATYLLSPLTVGLLWIVGLVLAMVLRTDATGNARAHLRSQVHLGVSGLIWLVVAYIVAGVLVVTIVGLLISWLPLLVWWLWTLVKCVQGVDRLTRGRDPEGREPRQ